MTDNIEYADCDEGRICPKCGKVMVLCEDERTYEIVSRKPALSRAG